MFPADILVGLLRLRKCSPEMFRPELKGGVSIVRELHVYPTQFTITNCTCSSSTSTLHTRTDLQTHLHMHYCSSSTYL